MGSLIGDSEDVKRRKGVSIVAMIETPIMLNKLFNIWINKKKGKSD